MRSGEAKAAAEFPDWVDCDDVFNTPRGRRFVPRPERCSVLDSPWLEPKLFSTAGKRADLAPTAPLRVKNYCGHAQRRRRGGSLCSTPTNDLHAGRRGNRLSAAHPHNGGKTDVSKLRGEPGVNGWLWFVIFMAPCLLFIAALVSQQRVITNGRRGPAKVQVNG